MCALINNFYGWKLYGNKENRDIYLRFMYATIGLIVFLELRHKIGSFLGCFKRPKRETTHLEILKEIKKHPKDYVFFEEFALDISRFKFTHPGGYFVIRDTIGEDIAKYMIGCSAYRHLNPYTHPTKALEFVKYLAIATIPYPLNYLTNKNNKYQDKMI